MAWARRHGTTVVTVLAIAVAALCANNVLGNVSEVEALARKAAACEAGCHLARMDRNPLSQRFEFEKKGATVIAVCSRSALLVGAYECAAK